MYKSCAEWPEGTVSEPGNITKDSHHEKGQARSVCNLLRLQGFGGEGKVFPVRTWVEPK